MYFSKRSLFLYKSKAEKDLNALQNFSCLSQGLIGLGKAKTNHAQSLWGLLIKHGNRNANNAMLLCQKAAKFNII